MTTPRSGGVSEAPRGRAVTVMATQLRGTDVVIVGLGAAGGVAAYPLAAAGLDVVGLEAGTWLDRRDFAPDEIRNNITLHMVDHVDQALERALLSKKTKRRAVGLPGTGPRKVAKPKRGESDVA